MVSFELDDEQKMVQETMLSFATDQMDPYLRESEESGQVVPDIITKGSELTIIASAVPDEYGGFGESPSALTGCIAYEELGWGDLSAALHLLSPTLFAYSVLHQGTEEQKKEYLPLFCEEQFKPAAGALVEPRFNYCASALTATAVREGDDYILNGSKCFVPLADTAEYLLVFAATTPGAGFAGVDAFIVPAGTAGLTVGEREQNMGLNALATFELTMKDLKVNKSAKLGEDGGSDFLSLLARSRLALGALAIGMSRHALEFSRDYAKERVAFGEPIASRQAIAFMIAEMAIEIDATRMLCWEAAWLADSKREFAKEACLAKNYAADMALMVADRSVQIRGGHGYVRENPVELWLRNARGFSSLDGMVMV